VKGGEQSGWSSVRRARTFFIGGREGVGRDFYARVVLLVLATWQGLAGTVGKGDAKLLGGSELRRLGLSICILIQLIQLFIG
jgi:hypothetical protein